MDVKEIGYEHADWTYLAQDSVQWLAVKNAVRNFWGGGGFTKRCFLRS
jgi:hypothetical protein